MKSYHIARHDEIVFQPRGAMLRLARIASFETRKIVMVSKEVEPDLIELDLGSVTPPR